MKTAIATDTNSGISFEEAEKAGIYLIPMPIIIDNRIYYENVDLSHRDFFEKQAQGLSISTTQPAPGDIMNLWDELLKEYDNVIYIPMSSGLSGSCQSAMIFAEEYNGRVTVIDNHRISVTQRSSVYSAKELADQGLDPSKIKKKLEDLAYESSIYITVNTMEYLKKGGRITASAAAIATVLNIKPVLSIMGDKLDSYAKVRGMKKARRLMIDTIKKELSEKYSHYPAQRIEIGTAGSHVNPGDLDEWTETVRKEFPGYTIVSAPLALSIAVHIGPDCEGIAAIVKC
ncbi:MAG: DegV family protein [Lachnospiraceae bacterium]|nr:DegV family protein [Lachnospiraceae bacterium]